MMDHRDYFYTTLRRFPDVQQSVVNSKKIAAETRVPTTEKRRPTTANPYDNKNRKYIESYNYKKIYAIRNEMKHLTRDSVSKQLDEVFKIRQQIPTVRRKEVEILNKDFNDFMIANMNPFESACIKLCRAGLLDLKDINFKNKYSGFTSAITKKVIESIYKNDSNLIDGHRNLEDGSFSVGVLGKMLATCGVMLNPQELFRLHKEMCNSIFNLRIC